MFLPINQGLVESANLVVQVMRKVGISAELLHIELQNTVEDTIDPSSPSLPPPQIVYCEVKSKSNPNGKTILFYNRYDIQPI